MQEPTNLIKRDARAAGVLGCARRALSSRFRANRIIAAAAIAVGVLSLPILGVAAEKKKADAKSPVAQPTAAAPIVPGAPVTPDALKIAAKAKPGQVIPVPAASDKPLDAVPLADILSGDKGAGVEAVPAQAASAVVRTDVYTVRETRKIVLPARSIIQMSHDVAPGHTALASSGRSGVLVRTYDVTYKGDKPIRYKLVGEKLVKKPQNRVMLAGIRTREARALPSRDGLYTRIREMDMIATGYSPYEGSATGRCATGMRAGYGVVAVDPRVIPLGTRLYIEGYGYAIAGDTGGAIRRNRIDLGMNTYRQADRVGRRLVHVYILGPVR